MSEQPAEQELAEAEVLQNEGGALDDEPSVVTDEDRMGTDPLEDGMDTAEGWSRDVRLGGTREREDTDTLAERIPQEEPDPALEEIDADPGRPVAATPAMELDASVDAPEHSIDGVGGDGVRDPLLDEGATQDAELTIGDREVELGLDAAEGSVEPGGLPTDDSIGTVVPVENEWPTEGAEAQAVHVEQER